jgi:hypothetical protein
VGSDQLSNKQVTVEILEVLTFLNFGTNVACSLNIHVGVNVADRLIWILRASRPTQQCEPSDDTGTNLIVLRFCVAVALELRRLPE